MLVVGDDDSRPFQSCPTLVNKNSNTVWCRALRTPQSDQSDPYSETTVETVTSGARLERWYSERRRASIGYLE